jgi:ATP adenylyltransferase
MDRLWTPWRLSYVTTAGDQTHPATNCVLCEALHRDDEPLVVHRGVAAFVVLNKFPYNNGHLMIVPSRHVARLADLSAGELSEMMVLAQSTERALTAAYGPHGFNMGINLGRSAGAGIADHLHLHVVPRWDGDTSFMTVFGDTRVLPEELAETAARLRAALAGVLAAPDSGGAR